MKLVILILTFVTTSLSLAAERAVIQQMKGRRAILQFEKDIPFSVGQKIHINSDDGSEYGVRKELRNPMERRNSIDMTATFGSIDSNPTTSFYTISGRYGWNLERYEFGPLVTVSFSKQSSEYSRYTAGGFFDFNLMPNKPGEDFIFGGYAEGSIGNGKSGGDSKSITVFTGGGFVKWFIFSPMLAARANLFYSNEKQDSASRNTTGVSLGLNHYF